MPARLSPNGREFAHSSTQTICEPNLPSIMAFRLWRIELSLPNKVSSPRNCKKSVRARIQAVETEGYGSKEGKYRYRSPWRVDGAAVGSVGPAAARLHN